EVGPGPAQSLGINAEVAPAVTPVAPQSVTPAPLQAAQPSVAGDAGVAWQSTREHFQDDHGWMFPETGHKYDSDMEVEAKGFNDVGWESVPEGIEPGEEFILDIVRPGIKRNGK